MSDDGYCCTPDSGDCCGPGSWCCSRAGKHEHDEINGPVKENEAMNESELASSARIYAIQECVESSAVVAPLDVQFLLDHITALECTIENLRNAIGPAL